MSFSFLPKEEKFFELFEVQAKYNVEGATLFLAMLKAWDMDSPSLPRLQEIEHEADITTHEIYDKLNRTFITPFDREDIHELAGEMDDVIDIVQSIAIRMQLYRIDRTSPDAVQLAGILKDATDNVAKAIGELKNKQKTRRVLDYCIEINRLENAGDRALGTAVGRLFEGKPDPLEIIKWKEIYEGIEAAIDKCEHIANVIESILVKAA